MKRKNRKTVDQLTPAEREKLYALNQRLIRKHPGAEAIVSLRAQNQEIARLRGNQS